MVLIWSSKTTNLDMFTDDDCIRISDMSGEFPTKILFLQVDVIIILVSWLYMNTWIFHKSQSSWFILQSYSLNFYLFVERTDTKIHTHLKPWNQQTPTRHLAYKWDLQGFVLRENLLVHRDPAEPVSVSSNNLISTTKSSWTRMACMEIICIPQEWWARVETWDHHNGAKPAWKHPLPKLCTVSLHEFSPMMLLITIWSVSNNHWKEMKDRYYIGVEKYWTCAGNLDSPLHFLSSQAVGSMFEPPKVVACEKQQRRRNHGVIRASQEHHWEIKVV